MTHISSSLRAAADSLSDLHTSRSAAADAPEVCEPADPRVLPVRAGRRRLFDQLGEINRWIDDSIVGDMICVLAIFAILFVGMWGGYAAGLPTGGEELMRGVR